MNVPVADERGYIAIKYYLPHNKYVRVGGERDFREYLFVPGNAGICMAWVHPADAETVINMKEGTCCGGRSSQVFRYANEQDVRIWTGVAER